MTANYGNDEKSLCLRLLMIQMLFIFCSINPSMAKFRPELPTAFMHCTVNPKYLKVFAETNKWSEGYKMLNFHCKFTMNKSSAEEKEVLAFCANFIDSTQKGFNCPAMTSKMFGYDGPAIILSPECDRYYRNEFRKSNFYKLVSAIRTCQLLFCPIRPGTKFHSSSQNEFSFEATFDYSLEVIHRFDSKYIYPIVSSDYSKVSLNSIVSANMSFQSSQSAKTKKQ